MVISTTKIKQNFHVKIVKTYVSYLMHFQDEMVRFFTPKEGCLKVKVLNVL